MSSIAELEARLAKYRKTEEEILDHGQKTVDEDDRELQRPTLSTVQNKITDLETRISNLKKPKRSRTRQYRVKV